MDETTKDEGREGRGGEREYDVQWMQNTSVNELAKLVDECGMDVSRRTGDQRAGVQAMELISFSALPRTLDVDIERWSVSRLGSVWGIPTLNSVARNLLMFPWRTHTSNRLSVDAGKAVPYR